MEKTQDGKIILEEQEYKNLIKSAQLVGYVDGATEVITKMETNISASFAQVKTNLTKGLSELKEQFNKLKQLK